MINLKNKLCIDFASNPEWGSLFVASKPGDKVTMTVEFTIDEVTASELTASLDEVSMPQLDGGAQPPEGSDDVEPPDTSINPKAPVFMTMNRDKGEYGS